MVLEGTIERGGRTDALKETAAAAILFGVSFSLYLFFGSHSLWDAEAMYAEAPREMLSTGNLFYPTLNFAPFLYKPPLYFWTNMASMALLGQNMLALRLPTAVFAAGTVVLAFLIGRRVSPRAGLYSGAVMATLFGFTFHTAMLLPDYPLAFFVSASVLFFIKAINGERGGVAGVYASLALAVMTKGFIGLVLPGLAFLSYMALEKRWDVARRFASAWGILVFLLITVPWHVMMELKNPDFLYNFIINEQVLRFFNRRFPPDWDSVPTSLFIPITLGWLLPWSFFLLKAVSRGSFREAGTALKVSLLWGLSGMIFLAVSSSKMEYYALPVLPAFSVAVGSWWAGLAGRDGLSWAKSGALALAIFAAAGLAALKGLEGVMRSDLDLSAADASGLMAVAVRSLAALLAGGVIGFLFIRRGRAAPAFWSVLASAMLFSLASQGMMRYITPSLSSAEAAKSIASISRPGDLVVVDGGHEFEYSTTYCFYLKDRVLILLNDGNPVLSIRPQEGAGFLLDDEEFRRIWGSGKRAFFITERDPASAKIAGLPDCAFRKVFERTGRTVFINRM